MSDDQQHSSTTSTVAIRIEGINTDKTRKAEGSDTVYQVYFDLSGTPPQGWSNFLKQEWKTLNPTQPQLWQEVSIDNKFLVLHCTLQEVSMYLQSLKKAIIAANKTYERYVQEETTEQEHREDVWKQERKAVDDMAKSLHFE